MQIQQPILGNVSNIEIDGKLDRYLFCIYKIQ